MKLEDPQRKTTSRDVSETLFSTLGIRDLDVAISVTWSFLFLGWRMAGFRAMPVPHMALLD